MEKRQEHDPPDLEDAYDGLRRIGFDGAVFEFIHMTKGGEKVEVAPQNASVLIRNSENNVQRIYDAAGGDDWTAAFLEDVRAGIYGKPPKGATTKLAL